jgi:HK97 family phage portal protein
LYQLWSSLLLDGNAYGLVTETGVNGFPVTVEILDPMTVQWRHVEGEWTTLINEKRINLWPNGPLWHMPMFSMPGMPMGQSPISASKQAIGSGISAEQFGAQFFDAGGNPNAIIYSDSELTPEQAQGIKGAFTNATQGNREPAIMGSGLKYERVQISPDESQFLDSQRFTVEQIARIYGIPPELIGAATSGSSVTYANREQRAADWLSFGLMPYLIPIEDALSTLVPRAQRVKFNVDGLLRSDLSTRYAAHAVGIGSGFLTVDEARAYEDLPPLVAEDQPLPVDQVIA